MPSHPDRVRTAPLPDGYQFGDARAPEASLEGATVLVDGVLHTLHALGWRAPHLNAAEQLQRRAGWNVIEGEHFASDAERAPVVEGAPINRSLGVRILNA